MSQYMLLIYRPVDGPPAGQPEPPMEAWSEYTQSLQDAGALLGGAPLESVESATTVRARDGETQITDGPFAETKEFLAGYYLLARPWAAHAPAGAVSPSGCDRGAARTRPQRRGGRLACDRRAVPRALASRPFARGRDQPRGGRGLRARRRGRHRRARAATRGPVTRALPAAARGRGGVAH